MSCLPQQGCVVCVSCHLQVATRIYGGEYFDAELFECELKSEALTDGDWSLNAGTSTWGNPNAECLLLTFTNRSQHWEPSTAFEGSSTAVAKILTHLGPIATGEDINKLISDQTGRFHVGSLIRCSLAYRGTEAGCRVLDKFVDTPFGKEVTGRCTTKFLRDLPTATRLVILFGLGTRGNYVTAAREVIERARPGDWETINEVAYSDGKVTFVHVEHFATKGSLLQQWLGEYKHERAKYGAMARDAVAKSGFAVIERAKTRSRPQEGP